MWSVELAATKLNLLVVDFSLKYQMSSLSNLKIQVRAGN